MERYGAPVERGIIKEITEHGYIVQSIDRYGIETPPIKQIHNEKLSVEDRVYFYLHGDGTGKIICLVNSEEGQAALDIYIEQIIANTAARHTHANKPTLDTLAPMTNAEIEALIHL